MYSPNHKFPKSESELFKELEDQLINLEASFECLHRESIEESLLAENSAFTTEDNIGLCESFIIKYRRSDYQPNIDLFLTEFMENYPKLHALTKQRSVTPELFSIWWRVSTAFGYVMNSAFALGNDMGNVRGGKGKARTSQKRWVATIINNAMKAGLPRARAEELLHLEIRRILESGPFSREFPPKWYQSIIDENKQQLKTTYDKTALLRWKMDELIPDEKIPIPPLVKLKGP